MKRQSRSRRAILLGLMVVLGLIYLSLLAYLQPLTGSFRTDGIISVLLGLYICSHPVANALDLLLFHRYMPRGMVSVRVEVLWWMLNAAVLFTGWYIIFVGMLRFSVPVK